MSESDIKDMEMELTVKRQQVVDLELARDNLIRAASHTGQELVIKTRQLRTLSRTIARLCGADDEFDDGL